MDFFHIEIHDSHTHSHTQKMKYIVIAFCLKKGTHVERRGLSETEASIWVQKIVLKRPDLITWKEPELSYDAHIALIGSQLDREYNQFCKEQRLVLGC